MDLPLKVISRSIRPSNLNGRWSYEHATLSTDLKFLFRSRAVVATFLNIVLPRIVISAPESISPKMGTPCIFTRTQRGALPASLTCTTLTVPSSESDEESRKEIGDGCTFSPFSFS